MRAGPILDIGEMGAFFGGTFFEKGHFACTPKQMSFLTVPNENIFFKTQGTMLG